jgi:hypothetical protein
LVLSTKTRSGNVATLFDAVLVLLLIAFPLVGFATRRWLALVLPAIAWPTLYVGLDRGWWGTGTGDGWQYVALAATAAGVASTALAVAVARKAWPHPDIRG